MIRFSTVGVGNTHLPEGDTHGKTRERFESLILRKTLRTPRVSVHNTFAHNHLTEVAVLFEMLLPGAFVNQPCAMREKGMLRVGYAYLVGISKSNLCCAHPRCA